MAGGCRCGGRRTSAWWTNVPQGDRLPAQLAVLQRNVDRVRVDRWGSASDVQPAGSRRAPSRRALPHHLLAVRSKSWAATTSIPPARVRIKVMSADPFQLPLDSADATLGLVGGKGASLARMATAGLPVPPGFHVTTAAYRRFVEANALQAVIAKATANAQPDDPASLERASALSKRRRAGSSRSRDPRRLHQPWRGRADGGGAGSGGALIRHRRRPPWAVLRRPVRELPQRSG
jgi:hypothetical protein